MKTKWELKETSAGKFDLVTQDGTTIGWDMSHRMAQQIAAMHNSEQQTPRVLLTIEGGALQNVDADSPCRVLLLDFDTDGCDDEDLLTINGSSCVVSDYKLTGEEKDAQNAVRGAFLLAKVTP
jgi:hypothetical protein